MLAVARAGSVLHRFRLVPLLERSVLHEVHFSFDENATSVFVR